MKLIKPYHEILTDINPINILKNIETAGRTCYKSEKLITEDTSKTFVNNIIKNKHESVLEHQSLSIRLVCDRGVSYEVVRHRIASFSQESTRYCNYNKNSEVTFIIPCWSNIPENTYDIDWSNGLYGNCLNEPSMSKEDKIWFWNSAISERDYIKLILNGWKPQQARSVLTNSLKTEIVVTMNLREWRHFFNLRAAGSAGVPHPQMLEITIPLLNDLKNKLPIVFDDINVK